VVNTNGFVDLLTLIVELSILNRSASRMSYGTGTGTSTGAAFKSSSYRFKNMYIMGRTDIRTDGVQSEMGLLEKDWERLVASEVDERTNENSSVSRGLVVSAPDCTVRRPRFESHCERLRLSR